MDTKPTRQQRDIMSGLSQTLSTFQPNQSPYPSARTPEPPARRRNPRALIVPADRITVDPDQVRKAEREATSSRIQELARSIQAVGLQQPPGVRELPDGTYTIVYGEGRFTAMTKVLGWTEIEVLKVEVTDAELVWHQLHENIHRTDLSPLDLAAAVKQAQGQGLSLKDIALRVGKSEPWVQKALTVAHRLTDEAKAVLAAAEARPAMESIYAMAQVAPEAQVEIAREVADRKLSRVDTEVLVAAAKKEKPADHAAKRTGRKKKTKPFETTLRAANGASVSVRFRKVEVDHGEVIAALEDAIAHYRRKHKSAA